MERTPEFASLAGKPLHFEAHRQQFMGDAYMQKTCDVAEKAILAKKYLQKKCVNRDKM